MDFFLEIWQTINKNRSRSFLTAFGVFWGILMLMVLMGGGNGLKQFLSSMTGGLSANAGIVGANPTSIPYAGFQTGRTWTLSYSDVNVIKQKANTLEAVVPLIDGGSVIVSHGPSHQSYSIMGITPTFRKAQTCTVVQGRDISELDLRESRKVCVIGSQVKKVIFPNGENPVGQYILCGSMYMQVIGVLKEEEGGWQSQVNEQVHMPLTTLQKMQHKGENIDIIAIVSKSDVPVEQALEEVAVILRELHNISPEDKKAVGTRDFSFLFTITSMLTTGVFALIWLIGLGTLISGAVGVSNIMLVTVRERTKEIGVRRAIGASPWLIARQILAESVTLTAIAGVIGIMNGVIVLDIAERVMAKMQIEVGNIQVSLNIAIVSLVVIMLVGALAGLMPAIRALKIKPIEALNEE